MGGIIPAVGAGGCCKVEAIPFPELNLFQRPKHEPLTSLEKTTKPRWASIELFALFIILAGYVGWMLSLPCFPSGDGPVHMYYVHVLSALLSHNNPEYEHFFHIRHILPPYSLYYYGLLVLSKIVPMLLADRIIICVYFVSFVFGFRYLARAIGPSADLMTLLATLLLLNWPLGMGFVNFCLSLSFSFWATGLWLRTVGKRDIPGRIAFLVMVTAVMLTHPVPLLLLLAVTGTILLLRILHSSRGAGKFGLPQHGLADIVTLALAALNLGYVKLFAKANPLQQSKDVIPTSYWGEVLHRLGIYGREHALSFLLGRAPDLLVYRTCLILILVVPVVMAIRQRIRNRAAGVWTTGDSFLVLGGIIFVVLPFIPSQLNGLYYFADRLVICVWLAFLFAASGWSARAGEDVFTPVAAGEGQKLPLLAGTRLPISSRTAGIFCIAFAVISSAALLSGANRLVRPIAHAVAALDHTTISPPGQIGFIFEDSRKPVGGQHEGLSWNPYYWALVHVLRHNDAVMANAPWMDESIIPVAPSNPLPEVSIVALQEPFLTDVQRDMLRSPDDLKATLHSVTFFLENDFDRPVTTFNVLLHAAGPAAAGWTCSQTDLYRICDRAPVQWKP